MSALTKTYRLQLLLSLFLIASISSAQANGLVHGAVIGGHFVIQHRSILDGDPTKNQKQRIRDDRDHRNRPGEYQ